MLRFLLAVLYNLLFLAATAQKTIPVLYDSAYRMARFTDANRMQKISSSFATIDSMYKKFAEENHFPSISFGIVADGKLVYTNSYGYTNIKNKTRATSSSMYRIASMSKSFTCMAILKLRDEGKLNLDDPAYLYIPELKQLKYPTADAPHITIRHLMTHSAGFPEDNPWGDRQLADSDKELMEFLARQISFSNPPGIAFEYSNLGFALQGKIISKVSGMRYQEYIKTHILKPLGMPNTTYEYGDIPAGKLSHGYRWINNQWQEEELLHDAPDGSWGAMGAMISSIDEFSKYIAFNLSVWPPGNAKETGPIKRSSLREMHQPWRWDNPITVNLPGAVKCTMELAYSFGLRWLRDCEGRKHIYHSGGLPGFGSQWRMLPDYGIGVVAFANRTYAPIGTINMLVLDSLVKMAGLQPGELAPSAILEQRKNELLEFLPGWKNAVQSGIFAENFFPDYPIEGLRKQSADLFAKAGKIISLKPLKPENQLRGKFIIEGENTNLEVFFTLSPENPPLIQEYRLRELKK